MVQWNTGYPQQATIRSVHEGPPLVRRSPYIPKHPVNLPKLTRRASRGLDGEAALASAPFEFSSSLPTAPALTGLKRFDVVR
jgi:hypothetical protein